MENGGYELISGYDQYNVTIYNPTTKEARKMGLNDASQYFQMSEMTSSAAFLRNKKVRSLYKSAGYVIIIKDTKEKLNKFVID